jgi:hypothetical protein
LLPSLPASSCCKHKGMSNLYALIFVRLKHRYGCAKSTPNAHGYFPW